MTAIQNAKTGLMTLAGGLLLAASASAGLYFDIDFTASEGFKDGVALNGIRGFNAQTDWVATGTGAKGSATLAGGWARARRFPAFTLEVGGTIVMETTFRLSAAKWPRTDVYRFGFAGKAILPSGETPAIGSIIHSKGDGSFWIGSSDPAQRVNIPASAAGDWIKFTQTITRSAKSGEFTGTVSANNLTTGVDLGSSTTAWTQSTADGSWDGEMISSFRSMSAKGVKIEIDRWKVSTHPPKP